MIEEKIKILKESVGEKETDKILEIIIGVSKKFDTDIYTEITRIIKETFSLSQTELINNTSYSIRNVKRLYVYLLSEYTGFKKKDIALITETSERNIYRYNNYITDILKNPKDSVFFKMNEEFIIKSEIIIEKIEKFKKQKYLKWTTN